MSLHLGYALSSEEHGPTALVRFAGMAEQAGVEFAMLSDHFHPWIDQQGQSPFAWATLGGIASTTSVLEVGTGVTCPTFRTHPAIIAQAAATVARMMPGRFTLGVGSGEALNEHILGLRWPTPPERLEMLAEAIAVMRQLWTGAEVTHRGQYFTVEDARIYTLPGKPIPVVVAASGEAAATLAGQNDGLVVTSPSSKTIETFRQSGGGGKPTYGQITVCWAENAERGIDTAAKWWPNTLVPGQLNAELPRPSHFELFAKEPDRGAIAEAIVCGPDVAAYLKMVEKYQEAGLDHIYFHQVGPDQEGFLRFFEHELRPALQREMAA